MDKKIKEKEESKLRQPKAKTKRFGLKVPVIRMPHDDLIKPESPKLEIVASKDEQTLPSLTTPSSHSSQTRQSTLTRQSRQSIESSHLSLSEIAPVKNFQKVANSISKQAVPDGWFKGKSKQLYDALYSLTRGAITPSRKIRVQKSKLMRLASIGSRITFDTNIQHLISVGLIVEKVYAGEHEGNEFEVLLPEEITLPRQSSQTSQSSLTSHAQKLDRLVSLETSQTSQSITLLDARTSENAKTSLKTNTTDDEAFSEMVGKLSKAVERITGKKTSKSDTEKWSALADLLILELEIAATRSGSVSSVPAFLTEVLRRQFFSARQQKPAAKSANVKPDTVGKSESESFEIKSLDEQGREAALEQLREFAGESFLEDFKKWYTAEDWQWLMKKLKDTPNENL